MSASPVSTASILVNRAERDQLGIVLNRAEKANALTAAMMMDIARAVSDARAHDVILFSSASSRLFCAGADISEFLGGGLPAQEHALLAMVSAMAGSRAPIVMIAHGRASGAGAILLSLADVVIAAEDLQVACPEFVFGMYPIIVEAVLRSRLSPALATRMCLGAGVFNAAQAEDAGIVTETLPIDDFPTAAAERARYYFERQPGLSAMRRSRNMSVSTATMLEQLVKVAPLMLENFAAQSVRERISDYLANLGKRSRE